MTFRIAASAAACALASLAVPGAAQTYDWGQVKERVTQDDLVAIVDAYGHKVLQLGSGTEALVVARDEDRGILYTLSGRGCGMDGIPGCRGVLIASTFKLPTVASYETVAKANLDMRSISTAADFDGMLIHFSHFELLDYGVTMANLRENVGVTLSLSLEALPIAAGEK